MSGTNLSFAQSPPPITLPARAEETIGGLEDWRTGGFEDWKLNPPILLPLVC